MKMFATLAAIIGAYVVMLLGLFALMHASVLMHEENERTDYLSFDNEDFNFLDPYDRFKDDEATFADYGDEADSK